MEVKLATTLMLGLFIVGLLEWHFSSVAKLYVRHARMTLVVTIVALFKACSDFVSH